MNSDTFDSTLCELTIADDVIDAIHAHLSAAYPNEGCGVLIGKSETTKRIAMVRAAGTRNAETRRGEDRFSIHPLDFLAIERELDAVKDGTRIVGFFHSHPDSPARPSSIDLEMAQGLFDVTQAYYVYAITRVDAGRPGGTTYWRLALDGSKFVEC